jgi:hypothetical protein
MRAGGRIRTSDLLLRPAFGLLGTGLGFAFT